MYVCICNAVTERQIRECARDGATTVADLRNKLLVGNTCGKCVQHAKTVLREVHGERESSRAPADADSTLG